MLTEGFYAAESKARDILSMHGVEFGDEMTEEVEARLLSLTREILLHGGMK